MLMKIMVDNLSAINLAKHLVASSRREHIETRFHFLRNQVKKGKIELVHCRIEDQIVDIMTKPLEIERFEMAQKRVRQYLCSV